MEYPRISKLPKEERKPFLHWLRGQTRPWVKYGDEYYPWDYDRWVASGKPNDQGADWD